MTTAEAATELGLSKRHVRTLIEQGDLPAERQETQRGAVLWLLPSDLDAFKRRRIESARAPGKRKKGRPLKLPPEPDPAD